MLKTRITKDEQDILEFHYKKSGTRLIRERAHALLLSNQEKTAPEIARILFRAENTIREWLKVFETERISSIFPNYEDNLNASKLTREQLEEIKEALGKPPSAYGLPRQFWTPEILKTYLKAQFGVVYESDRSYHFLLKFSDLSFKLPSPFDIRRDEKCVARRMVEIHEEIKPFLMDKAWEVLVSDETRITWESEIRRAWLKKGEKTTLKVERERRAQSFIGMLNLKSKKPHLYEVPWQNQEQVITALKGLKKNYPQKHICLIWDNARWHKGKLLRRELSQGRPLENFHLINFPPYAPDKNPQEKVWNYAKNTIANTEGGESFETMIQNFRQAILGKRFNYSL